jgi:benzoyl-CoA 2,3-dioxygenase component A
MADRPTPSVKQHLIDPEICIRCNTCEATCPVGAITHDSRNYVVDAAKCNLCMDCISPCPTGSIDNWRTMPRVRWPTAWKRSWAGTSLPAELSAAELAGAGAPTPRRPAPAAPRRARPRRAARPSTARATTPRCRPGAPRTPTPTCTAPRPPRSPSPPPWWAMCASPRSGREYDTHHVVLDFGAMPFPVLEGQSIGIMPPGVDASGRPHHARQYSIASPRNGERPGYNNLSLTVKRVLEDHQGQPVRGVASNYLCDLQVGDKVQVIGPSAPAS